MKSRKPSFKKGWSYQVVFSWSHHTHRIYILEVIDSHMIVYKYFGRHKQWWHYGITHRSTLEMYYQWAKQKKKYPPIKAVTE